MKWEYCKERHALVSVDDICNECSRDCYVKDKLQLRKEKRYGWTESYIDSCLEYNKGKDLGLKGRICLWPTFEGVEMIHAVVGWVKAGGRGLFWDIWDSQYFSPDKVLEAMNWVEKAVDYWKEKAWQRYAKEGIRRREFLMREVGTFWGRLTDYCDRYRRKFEVVGNEAIFLAERMGNTAKSLARRGILEMKKIKGFWYVKRKGGEVVERREV